MQTLRVPRMLSVLTLYVCCVLASGQISAEQTCSFSIPNNKPLFDTLSKLFDRDSQTAIIEYKVRIRNDSGSFNLYEGSSPNSFQPWKWYRTQGKGTSHLLLTGDFYFGMLRSCFLRSGIKKVDLDLVVSPPGCLHGAAGDTPDKLIRDFLLQDLNIGDYSSTWAVALSDTVEICTARIDFSDRTKGEQLVYRCCSYNSDKQVICDDDSANNWAFALNIVILLVSILLVIILIWKFGDHINLWNKCRTEESNIYVLDYTYSFLLKRQGKVETQNIVRTPKHLLNLIQGLIPKTDPPGANYVVTVRETRVNMPSNQLLSELDTVDMLQRWLKDIFLTVDEKPSIQRAGIIFAILFMVLVPSIPFLIFMFFDNGWYSQLVDAYSARGLKGPFYFQWLKCVKAQIILVWFFFAFNAVCAFACFFTYLFWHRIPKKPHSTVASLVALVVFSPLLLIDTHFLVSLSVMLVFTIIVQSNKYTVGLQVILTLLPYVIDYYHDCFRTQNALKSTLLELFGKERPLQKDNTVSAITNETLDKALRRLGIAIEATEATEATEAAKATEATAATEATEAAKATEAQEATEAKTAIEATEATEKIEFKIGSENLQLQLNRPFLFLSKYDVSSISQNFFSHCLTFDCRSVPRKFKLKDLTKGLALVWTGIKIALVIISIKAYGDIYHISASNSFFVSLLVTLAPLVAKLISHVKASPSDTTNCLDRRLYTELREGMKKKFKDSLTVIDFKDFTIRVASSDDANTTRLKLEYSVPTDQTKSDDKRTNKNASSDDGTQHV
ncbi:unnamed protein product [Lymnaea stagnalis]|uniref:Uncharacterized protein n=1 Tax=Lymnaea stagnalis TaxID=6523 RepID=A0AAV2H292_LYMST